MAVASYSQIKTLRSHIKTLQHSLPARHGCESMTKLSASGFLTPTVLGQVDTAHSETVRQRGLIGVLRKVIATSVILCCTIGVCEYLCPPCRPAL